MARYWMNIVVGVLLIHFRVVLAGCDPNIKQQVAYDDNKFGQVYDLRGEAKIHATKNDNRMWVTECEVPVPSKSMTGSNYCEHSADFPKAMTLFIDDQLNMKLSYDGGGAFTSTLIPRTLFPAPSTDTIYMESKARFIYSNRAYDVYVYLRLYKDQDALQNNVYKTYRIEFFDVADEDCRNNESPNIHNVIGIAKWIPLTSGLVSLDAFSELLKGRMPSDANRTGVGVITADPVHLDESQVGDGSEPKHQ